MMSDWLPPGIPSLERQTVKWMARRMECCGLRTL